MVMCHAGFTDSNKTAFVVHGLVLLFLHPASHGTTDAAKRAISETTGDSQNDPSDNMLQPAL